MKKKIIPIVLIVALLGVAGFFAGKVLLKQGEKVAATWYSNEETEFVIETAEQLYELAQLSEKNDFTGQTFKLGTNLVLNEGNATDWAEKGPEKNWYPIENFNGTFDGQGYTISGLYSKVDYQATGLFINTGSKSVIRDFKLVNSYIEAKDSFGTAAVVGGNKNAGQFEKIYTDAIIDCDGRYTGGIISILSGNCSISECQFDGIIYRHLFNDIAGGVVAAVATGRTTMEHCLFSGTIYQDRTFYGYAKQHAKLGGLCGPVEGTSALTLKDCLSVGVIETKATSQIGAAVGFVSQSSTTVFDVVFTSTDTYRLNIGSNELYTTGSPILLQADMLKGNNAYVWTNLDYENYWTIVEDSTPQLQYFADKKANTEGIERKYDISWYNETEKEYTLTTIEQMYGLSLLSACKDFTGVTIKLGNDITLNQGDAATWSEKAPEYTWIPILSWEGIFDGQGHTISGLYKVGGTGIALFGETKSSSEIRNLSVKNSYFANKTDTDNLAIGGVVGQGGGILHTLYSDVIIESTGLRAGGIVGFVNCKDSDTEITNCWYNGKITMYEKTGCCAGGILGQSYSNTNMMACLNTGVITGGGGNRIGGLVGNIGGASVNKVENCLSVGKVTNSGGSQTGSFVGITSTSATAEVYDTYTSLESATNVIGSLKLGTYVGYASKIPTINLTGNGGYEWTNLDFKDYWTIVKDGTPVLKSFASTNLSTAGLTKKFDLSWYKEDATSYTIADSKDLYGLAILAGGGITFEGKTIKVAADIAVNAGDASTWATVAPSNPWIPIQAFYGTFDGQGHTISGLYKTDGTKVGLFATTLDTATVKNLSLKNSYFANMTETGNVTIGGVAGIGGGTFDNIYSDVILASTGVRLGGIVGLVNYDGTKINNCWYNGTIDLYEKTGQCGGGIVGQIYKETTLNACLNTGTITGRGGNRIGGLIGNIGGVSTVTTKNSLNVGKVTNSGSQTGGFVGVVSTQATAIIDGVYVTEESNASALGYTKIGMFEGYAVRLPKEKMIGVGGYQWTNLDFKNNWTIVQEDTPMLKSFVTSSISTAGLEKKFDTSWYDETKESYVISDAKDLWGLAMIASGGIDFKNKEIKVSENISVNTGDATTWATTAPEDTWIPIKGFAGTFNGQGHSISGLYKKGGTKLGLFGDTTKDAVVKNLVVENSYFANLSSTGNVGIGGVAGQGGGTFDTIYVDIIMEANGLRVGGIIGYIGVKGTDIRNCWYAGTINMRQKGSCAGGIAGQIYYDTIITNCLNSGSITGEGGNRIGGVVGNPGGNSVVKVAETLNVGTIKNSGSQTGSLVGVVSTSATLQIESVYVTTESSANAIGSTKIGTIKGEATSVNAADIYCHKAKENAAGLDYDNVWSTLTKRTPILASFAIKAPEIVYEGVVADTSWYNETDKEFTLTTKEQLYGLTELSCCEDFKDVTIHLGNDIVVNEGNASEWGTTAPEYAWECIQTFAGTFDGHGYTISGLYQSAASGSKGLFLATTEDSEIRDLRLENSYFENTSINNSTGRVASIAAYGAGRYDTIYSNAILKNNRKLTGGIVADATTEYGDLEITNCLFAGEIITDSTLARDYVFGGIVGWARNEKTSIENCMFNGKIHYGTNNSRIAGIVARNGSGTIATKTKIDSVLVEGTITGTSNTATGQYIGAIYGQISGGTIDVSNAYSGNSVYKNENVSVDVVLVEPAGLTTLTRAELDGENALTNASGLWENSNTSWTTQAWHPVLTSFYWYNQDELLIRDAAELYDFVVKSKTDNFLNKTVKLGADITVNRGSTSEEVSKLANGTVTKWTPIGLNGSTINAFAGTFDGQGHSISGLYQVGESGSKGLFIATTSGSKVMNLKLVNSYFANTNIANSTGRVGAIAAYGAGTFDGIYCDVLLKNNRKLTGGIVGDATTTYGDLEVKNCWFAGEIVTDSTLAKDYTFGGIVGWARNNKTTITDCLFTGTIDYGTNNTRIAGILGRNGTTGVDTETTINNVIVAGSITGTTNTASGQYIGYVYGQKSVGTIVVTNTYADSSVYANKNTEVTVVLNKDGLKNGETQDLSKSTTNSLFGDNVNWVDTDAYDHPILENFKETEAKGALLVISTADELYDFAKRSQTYDFKGVTIQLGADITVNAGDSSEKIKELTNPIKWTPIGTKTVPFAGIFDGQGYTISGVYCADESSEKGLFLATAPTSVIKNLRFVNSYIATTKVATSAKRTAGIAAYGEGLFDSIYCNVLVENNTVVTGGIVADMQGLGGNLEIKNCWFAGTLKSANTSKKDVSLGGIIGWARNCEKATITDCLFTGTIDYGTEKGTSNVYAAGIVGRTQTTQIEMTRVLSVGTIKGSGGKNVDAICNDTSTICNSVYENVISETDITISTKPSSVGSLSSSQLSGDVAKEAGNADGLFAGDGATYWKTGDKYPVLSGLIK